MRLSELMGSESGGYGTMPRDDPEITGLTLDSRRVEPGYLFAAVPGSQVDGRRYIDDAVAQGAVAILTDDPQSYEALAHREPPVALLGDDNPRRRIARMAARFYRPQPETVVTVTGTNGKTSVTVFVRQLWHGLGIKAASLGTIGIVAPGFTRPGSLTTPDPVTLHSELNALAQGGVDHVVLEASSHGLDQYRLDGLKPKAAAFPNLTRDHLDYHGNMAAYRAAKERLFAEVLPKDGTAVVNLDDPIGADIAAASMARGQRVIGYGRKAGAALRLVATRPTPTGQDVRLDLFGTATRVMLPLLGEFQAMNALAALGLVIATGSAPTRAVASLAKLEGAPGRMELVGRHPSGAAVVVDYAHTPDALDHALRALRVHCRGRLIVVFGCGGDRDPGKRPEMGAIASRLADSVLVTDDNPRGENPAAIRRAILGAAPGAVEIGDRAAAIRHGLDLLRADDTLLIAGKGHETGQIVAGETLPFSDTLAARSALAALGHAA
ncbi:MAG: UDP-N-acetylmuramoyl-L-alanyl-D-glutamate--2,6-diaminopimelate ligase [Stellaceae bacterium]